MPLLSDHDHKTDHLSRNARPSVERILFALSSQERNEFFPVFDDSSLLPACCCWIDDSVLAHSEEWTRLIRDFQPTILVSCWSTHKIPVPLLSDEATTLRYVCHTAGSVRQVVPREFISCGGLVTNWGNLVSPIVAEHALLLILASLRNLDIWHGSSQPLPPGTWGSGFRLDTYSLRGKRVGLHGFGGIARELVRLLTPFGVHCSAYSQGVPPEYMLHHHVIPCENLDDLFARNDVVVECEALTPGTRGMVTERHLKLMPSTAVFVNIARGPIVDEEALARLAAQGRIRVASDVFHTEPLPEDSHLREVPNLIVSPHIGGPTRDCYARCGEFAFENIRRYLTGKQLEGIITLEIYDRST